MINIPNQYGELEYLHPIEWEKAFDVWRKNEAHQEMWKKHWEERGFASWDEWRKDYVSQLRPEELEWHLFELSNPSQNALLIYGAPTRGWIAKCYNGEITKQLKDILDYPIIKDNDKIKDIVNNFPEETIVTGIISNGKIVLIEGMHRTIALAKMARDRRKVDSNIKIVLADFSGEIPPLGRGNNK